MAWHLRDNVINMTASVEDRVHIHMPAWAVIPNYIPDPLDPADAMNAINGISAVEDKKINDAVPFDDESLPKTLALMHIRDDAPETVKRSYAKLQQRLRIVEQERQAPFMMQFQDSNISIPKVTYVNQPEFDQFVADCRAYTWQNLTETTFKGWIPNGRVLKKLGIYTIKYAAWRYFEFAPLALLNDDEFSMQDFERIRQHDTRDTFPRSGPYRKFTPVGAFVMCGWTGYYEEHYTLDPRREILYPPDPSGPMNLVRFGHVYRPL
jgi:hypothetical protein